MSPDGEVAARIKRKLPAVGTHVMLQDVGAAVSPQALEMALLGLRGNLRLPKTVLDQAELMIEPGVIISLNAIVRKKNNAFG